MVSISQEIVEHMLDLVKDATASTVSKTTTKSSIAATAANDDSNKWKQEILKDNFSLLFLFLFLFFPFSTCSF